MILEQFIKMSEIGKLQLRGDLGCGFFGVKQLVRNIFHGENHTVVKQTFAGVFLDDPAEIGTVVAEKRGEFRVGDAPSALAEYPVDAREQKGFHVALGGNMFAAVAIGITENTNQLGKELEKAKAGAVFGLNQGLLQFFK